MLSRDPYLLGVVGATNANLVAGPRPHRRKRLRVVPGGYAAPAPLPCRNHMAKVAFRFLNRAEVQALLPPTPTLLEVIESGLKAHGAGRLCSRRRATSTWTTGSTATSTCCRDSWRR